MTEPTRTCCRVNIAGIRIKWNSYAL